MNHLTHSLAGLLSGVFTFAGNSMYANPNKGTTAGFNNTYTLAQDLELIASD